MVDQLLTIAGCHAFAALLELFLQLIAATKACQVQEASNVRRYQKWDSLPFVPAVNSEVAVQSQNGAVGNQLRHSHQTGVGQGHGDILIALYQG
jgi:hypothetical protein